MLKVLLKKQMAEVFRSYFYNAKKKQMRSKGNIILLFALFFILIVGVLGGTFSFIALSLSSGLAPAGMGWLYFTLMSGIAIALGAFGSVFNTYAGLYLPKDNDLLLSMPIPVRTIILSRLLNVYLLGALYSCTVMIPTLIVWWLVAGATVSNVICGILLTLIVTLLVLILSCLLGWVVAKISVKLKNKSFITVLISIVFIGGYYFIYFKAQEWIRDVIVNASTYGTEIRNSAYILYLFGRIGEGDWLAAGIFTAVTILLTALVIFILSRGFLKLATATGNTKRVRYTEKSVKEKSVFSALLGKEFAHFTSSPNYMLNCGLGILILPALGIFLLIKGGEMLTVLNKALSSIPDCGVLLPCAIMMLLSTMINTAAPSVSLEGKSIWLLQSLPVEAKTVLRAKTAMQLILTAIPMLFTTICCAVVVQTSVVNLLLMCLLPLLFTVFMALFSTVSGVKHPLLEWTTEVTPIKQGGAVLLALFGGWGFVVLFALPYFFLSKLIGVTLYLAVWIVIFAVASVLLNRWLNTKGAKAFSEL